MKTFSEYQKQTVLTKEGRIADGDYIFSDINGVEITVRVKKGYLNDVISENGDILPAIETSNGSHVEHWKNGVLHCENGPAVIDIDDDYEEWWNNGKKQENLI